MVTTLLYFFGFYSFAIYMYDNVEIFALIITSLIIISGDWSWNRLNARHKYFAFVKQISPCKKKKKTGHFPFYILILWSLFTAGTAFLRITRWVRGTHAPKKMTKHIHITPPGVLFFIFSSTLQSTMTTVTIYFFLFKNRKRKLKIFFGVSW